MTRSIRSTLLAVLTAALVLAPGLPRPAAAAASTSRWFPLTGHLVSGRFLAYWDAHGGLAQQGYPLGDPVVEVSPTDGKPYLTQYFERAVFEYHPEQAGTPYEVLLSLLGVAAYQARYGAAGAPGQHASTAHPRVFPQTGHTLGGVFRAYWESHGGLMQQGFPITDEFTEISTLDGKPYTVQYFQRAVFEYHPEHAGTPYEVLLSQLGTARYQGQGAGLAIPPPLPGGRETEPVASADYLAWLDSPGGGPVRTGIRALDLHTGRVITVADPVHIAQSPELYGQLIIWEEADWQGNTTIQGMDLAAGTHFVVAGGPASNQGLPTPSGRNSPSVSGHTVVWIDGTGGGRRLQMKDLDSGVTTGQPTTGWVSTAVINDDYLVWDEIQDGTENEPATHHIRALDRHTGAVRDVATTAVMPSSPFRLLLNGPQLAWVATDTLTVTDLRSAATIEVIHGVDADVALAGDTLIWTRAEAGGSTLIGMHLSDPTPRELVPSPGYKFQPVLAGDWLVWTPGDTSPDAGHLAAVRLTTAFATMP